MCYFQSMSDRKPHRPAVTSVSRRISAIGSALRTVDLPEGVTLRSDEERTIWTQFTRARARDDWRDMDLILLSKVVRVEADLRKYQAMLDASGPLIKNKRETLIENPLLRVIDTLQRQQLAIIRSMSLNATGTDTRTMEASAKEESDARKVLANSGVESLLAHPVGYR
jgi:hypothetical protein